MKNVLATTIFSLAIVGLLILYAANRTNNQAQVLPKPQPTQSKASAKQKKIQTYTLADVAEHNSPQSCWLAIEDKVYDVTEFASSGNHPGGDAILNGCGKDATQMFNNRPDGSSHSATARSILPQFFIGNIVR